MYWQTVASCQIELDLGGNRHPSRTPWTKLGDWKLELEAGEDQLIGTRHTKATTRARGVVIYLDAERRGEPGKFFELVPMTG